MSVESVLSKEEFLQSDAYVLSIMQKENFSFLDVCFVQKLYQQCFVENI